MHYKLANNSSERLLYWLSRSPGYELAIRECACVGDICADLFGCYLLQVGWSQTFGAKIIGNRIRHRIILEECLSYVDSTNSIFGRADAMPIATDSIDVVFLPHILEFTDRPQQILQEVSRVLTSGGHLVLLGFNPWSVWGLYRLFYPYSKEVPWCGQFIGLHKLANWLTDYGLQIEQRYFIMFLPPLRKASLLWQLREVEPFIKDWLPFEGAVYVVRAVKRTPIVTPLWSNKIYNTSRLVVPAFKTAVMGTEHVV